MKMKMIEKRLVFCVAALVLALGMVAANDIYASDALKVKLDGSIVSFPDTQPYINGDNRTMVPVRFVSEALGCKVDWEQTNQLVTITKGPKRILLKIGENWAVVNDTKVDLRKEFDTKAVLKDDRTMVPLRFVSETLGAGVAWDAVNNIVIIRSDGTVEVIPTPVATPNPNIPVKPTGTPSYLNPIPGEPYFGAGINSLEDTKKFARLRGLLEYNDIAAIMGDVNGKDTGKLSVSYAKWNSHYKTYNGYLIVEASENNTMFDIYISKYGEEELQRLREVINIAITGDQDYKDFVYNSMVSCRSGSTGGKMDYVDGRSFYVKYTQVEPSTATWQKDHFEVVAYGRR